MSNRFWLLPVLLVLFCSSALGTITVTWNEPASNAEYANNAANRKTIDLNFTVVDDNATAPNDYNITLTWYSTTGAYSSANIHSIASDLNGDSSSNSDFNCLASATLGSHVWSTPGRDCTYKWTMPLESEMDDGTYTVDVNVVRWMHALGGPEYGIGDANADRTIVIDNRLDTLSALEALTDNFALVLAAVVLLVILGLGMALRIDLKTLVIVGVAGAVASAIAGMIIGTVIQTLW